MKHTGIMVPTRYIPRISFTLRNVGLRSRWRSFSTLRCNQIDEFTVARTRTPFIEAFRKQNEAASGSTSIEASKEKVESDLSPRAMGNSFTRIILPLARDPWLLDGYINSSGHIRLGKIFMDLDALAGVIGYKHTGDSVMTVTAAVDRISLQRPLSEICDLELSGQVTFATGRSSMEISIQVSKAPAEDQTTQEKDVLMTCAFTMVSLDPSTKRPVAIAPLNPTTPQEQKLFEQGQSNYNLKKSLSGLALRKQTPNDEESDLMHQIWLQQLDYHDPNSLSRKPDSALYMKNTAISSVQIMQPQYRNRHNFMIFGGFLLKTTFELAFTCAASISHCRPTFIALDPSTFENPVPVGSVLYLTATCAYSDSPLVSSDGVDEDGDGKSRIQIRVDSKVRNIEHGETKSTGTFNYTFEVSKEIKIIPESYKDFMLFLDARRRYLQNKESGGHPGQLHQGKGGVME